MSLPVLFDKILNFIKKIPITVLIIIIIQCGFIAFYYREEFVSNNIFIFLIEFIKTFLNITLIFWLITIASGKLKRVSGIINIIFIFLYTLLILYHYHTKTHLDFLILSEFRFDILSPEVFVMIFNYMGIKTIIFLTILLCGLIIFQLKWKLFSYNKNLKKRFPLFISFTLIFLIINILPVNSWDEITGFTKSVLRWYRIQYVFSDENYSSIKQYPYIKSGVNSNFTINRNNLPNIIIIPIESFNAYFVEKKSDSGKEITPFFNSLIPKGLYIENFYGNSVITVKGHLSILFSILPSFRGLVTEDYYQNNFQSLAEILKSTGYKTIFYQGSDNSSLKFQNEGPFLSRNGFDLCKGIDDFPQDYNIKENKSNYNFYDPKNEKGFGGYKDYILYKQFFNTLDSLHAVDNHQKFFSFLAPYSGHAPWLRENGDTTIPFPNPKTIKEDYANSLFRIDSYLRIFFKELKERKYLDNSIIIITGDHSHPVLDESKIHRGVGFYEENFRIPFLLLWNDSVQPVRIKDQAWSQIDIAPSILDLLNVNVTNHFLGKSFFNKIQAEENFVYLLQPFDKLYFCIVNYPYKYVYDVSDDQEYLFDLKSDPWEKNNIKSLNKEKFKTLREKKFLFELNQHLLVHNRIWARKTNRGSLAKEIQFLEETSK